MITLVAALITGIGAVAAALITTRQRGPAGTVPVTAGGPPVPAAQSGQGRTSKSLWCGIAGLFLWVLPVLGYLVILPGLYIGIRELRGPRRHTTTGLVLCIVGLGLALVNSAIGAYMGAHGQL